MRKNWLGALALGIAALFGAQAQAAGTVKIGLVLPYSGFSADGARDIDNGVKLWMMQHGDTVAGKKIEVIRKDTGGIAPDVAKRLSQELVVRDGAQILAGYLLTPNALAGAQVSQQAKTFMVDMNAATSIIPTKSDYMVRVSFTTPMIATAIANWAIENGIKSVHTLVADYGPGQDAEKAFAKAFQAAGGKVVSSDRFPPASPDFSSYVQRAKDSGAQALFIFVPGGSQPAALAKTLAEKGIDPEKTPVLGSGEITTEDALASMGKDAKGIVTAFNWDITHNSPENKAFVKAYQDAFHINPSFFSVGGYDGMRVIYDALKKTNGDTSGKALVDAAKGMSFTSPRGPVTIDPQTRDVVENIYIRKVEDVNGKLQNVEIKTYPEQKDPILQEMLKK